MRKQKIRSSIYFIYAFDIENSDGENLIRDTSLLTDEMVFTNNIYRALYNVLATLSTEEQLLLFDLFINNKALRSITDCKYCSSVIICRHRDKIFKKFSTLLKNYKDNILKKYCNLWTFCELLNKFYKKQLKISIYIIRRLCYKKSTFIYI